MDKRFIKILFLTVVILIGYFLVKPLIKSGGANTEMTFFGLGKADSILIQNGEKNILIDTGEKKHEEILVNKLKVLDVNKIDYLILTHPDKDHIGGASKIIDTFEVGQIFQTSFQKGSKAQSSLEKSIEEKKVKTTIPKEVTDIKLGSLNCTIYPANKDEYKKSNDYSLVMLVNDDKLNYVFAGDAEKKRINELLKIDFPKIDLLKVPHHGRANSSSTKLIEKLSPTYAVITNYESEADEEVLNSLEKEKTKYFYTSQKDIHFLSDGEKLQFY